MTSSSVIIEKLEKQNKGLRRREKEYFDEMVERGKELEHIRKIVNGCDDQMTPEVLDMLWEPLKTYFERCSVTGRGREKVRLKE